MTTVPATTAAQVSTNMLIDFPLDHVLLDLHRRFDFMMVFDVADGNLNGNPDDEGRPRIDFDTGRSYGTDVCIKKGGFRKAVPILLGSGYKPLKYTGKGLAPEYNIYIDDSSVLNRKHEAVYKNLGIQATSELSWRLSDDIKEFFFVDDEPIEVPTGFSLVEDTDGWAMNYNGELDADGLKAAKAEFGKLAHKRASAWATKMMKEIKKPNLPKAKKQDLAAEFCRLHVDVRWFGAVGDTTVPVGTIKGPFQFLAAHSVAPFRMQNDVLTRDASTRVQDEDRKNKELAGRSVGQHTMYTCRGFYNPWFAQRSGLTQGDLHLFWNCLYNFGRFMGSASRGHIEAVGIYIFAHSHPLGNAHAHELFDRIQVATNPGVVTPETVDDYQVKLDLGAMPEGVQLVKLYERKKRSLPTGHDGTASDAESPIHG